MGGSGAGRREPADGRGGAGGRFAEPLYFGVAPGWPHAGADFSSASSDFKALGAFFCNFATSQLCRCCGSSAGIAHGQPRAPLTTSCGFEAAGLDSIFSSRCGAISRRLLSAVSLSRRDPGDRNVSVQKIEDRLGGLRQDGGTRTNIERLRRSGKKFVERLGSYATLPNPKSFPQVFEGIFSSK
jgi:hypothetical protein